MTKLNWIIMFSALVFICACDYVSADCNKVYATVGAGYKFQERTKLTIDNVEYDTDQSPISARIELGMQCNENLRFGVSHRSQWLQGWPVNDKKEYSVTEVFVDYTYYWDI